MKTYIYNQDYNPIEVSNNLYLDKDCQTDYLEYLSIFPDDLYRWEICLMNEIITINTKEEKDDIKLLLKLLKKYIK